MTPQRPPNKQATVAELYAVLGQLVTAYDDVMRTFRDVMTDIVGMRADIAEVELFVNTHLADAVTQSGLWEGIAKIHREKANELRIQIALMAADGRKAELVIPVPVVGDDEVKDGI